MAADSFVRLTAHKPLLWPGSSCTCCGATNQPLVTHREERQHSYMEPGAFMKSTGEIQIPVCGQCKNHIEHSEDATQTYAWIMVGFTMISLAATIIWGGSAWDAVARKVPSLADLKEQSPFIIFGLWLVIEIAVAIFLTRWMLRSVRHATANCKANGSPVKILGWRPHFPGCLWKAPKYLPQAGYFVLSFVNRATSDNLVDQFVRANSLAGNLIEVSDRAEDAKAWQEARL